MIFFETLTWYENLVRVYATMIETGVHFAQANYGDGEWGCILGQRTTNSQGEVYCDKLMHSLRDTLTSPSGMWCGSNPGDKLREEVTQWVEKNEIDAPWVPKETLAAANVNGTIAPLFRTLRGRNVVLVGPRHLSKMPKKVIGDFRHVVVPDAVAWKVSEKTRLEVMEKLDIDCSTVLFSAGMGTNLMIHELWSKLRGTVTMIDTGAIFDPYVGVLSRKAYKRDKFLNHSMEANLS